MLQIRGLVFLSIVLLIIVFAIVAYFLFMMSTDVLDYLV